MSTTGTAVVPRRLLEALSAVTVSADGLRAQVGEREVTAESPREMRRLLSESLYDELHTGSRVEKGDLSFRFRDEQMEEILAGAVPHQKTIKRARVIEVIEEGAGDGADSHILAELEGVRVRLPREVIVEGDPDSPGSVIGLSFTVRRPALSPGFFMVDGTRTRGSGSGVLRLYVHLTDWREAAPVWGAVLSHLEDNEIPFRSKVLSARALYARRDALVVYLGGDAAAAAPQIAEVVRGMPGVGEETSVFAQELAPGVATAAEPEDRRPGMSGLSFGQHRATAVATALLEHSANGGSLSDHLATAFTEAGIDPRVPARNVEQPAPSE